MNRSRFNLSFRTGLLALISVTLILLSIRIFPNILPSLKMLDYRDVAVKSLTTEQMNALKGLKFTEGPEISKSQLPKNCRVIRPGMIYTMDFDEDRLNVHLNKDGRIDKVKIG